MVLREKLKPTTFYHMAVCKYAEKGFRKTKNGKFHGEEGTFMSCNDKLIFVGWSGSVLTVEG